MPAMALAGLPLAMADGRLPRRAAWAAIALQAVVCWPQALESLAAGLRSFACTIFRWRAALRIEPEADYLARAQLPSTAWRG